MVPMGRARGALAAVVLWLGAEVFVGWLRSRERRRLRLAGVHPEDVASGHEEGDMPVTSNLTFVAVLIFGLGVAGLLVNSVMVWRAGAPVHIGAPLAQLGDAATTGRFPEPRLLVNAEQARTERTAHEDRQLRTYRWVDRSAGVVAIPIDRAMDLIASRGLPTRATGPSLPPNDLASGPPSDASSGRVVGGR
jgi:hypothetical protein